MFNLSQLFMNCFNHCAQFGCNYSEDHSERQEEQKPNHPWIFGQLLQIDFQLCTLV